MADELTEDGGAVGPGPPRLVTYWGHWRMRVSSELLGWREKEKGTGHTGE